MAFIELKEVFYRYPESEEWVLKGVNLSVGSERVVITGRTGSGKTTLLRVMSGVALKVYGGELRGEVLIEGRVAYVPQEFDLYILMPTPREELTYILSAQNLGLNDVEVRIREISELLGIKELLDRRVVKLSMGERQRVAIASAIALNPEILILDEPFAHIDPKGAVDLVRLLSNLGVSTLVISEHKLRYLANIIDRVVVLLDGTVVYSGSLEGAPKDPDIEWPLSMLRW
jgi:energy-coupling factor transporter ATP-binding protein EcfA2